jgi:hypothetical protein
MIRINYDALGIGAALACAIHCAVLPLVFSSLPLFGTNIIDNKAFEYIMIALAFSIGVFSLWHGYRKHHHSFLPIAIFSGGFLLLILNQLFHQWFIYFLVPAVLLIITAHWLNYRACKKASHCHKDDCNHS